ncbi:MAG: LytR C-terminal domain-containing protein [Ignavibacteria bacterium]|nr:LytR C-terminal domain-containing protein [Ignavibacteria bacterium]
MLSKIKDIFFYLSTLIFFVLFFLVGLSLYFKYQPINKKQDLKSSSIVFESYPIGKVEILNGTKIAGLAREMMLYLKNFEIESKIANHQKEFERTVVFFRPNSYRVVNFLSAIIDFPKDKLLPMDTTFDSSFDAVLILGYDYKLLKPYR